MRVTALEINLNNPEVRARINKIRNLEELKDGTKLTARNIGDDETVSPGRLTDYDLRVFEKDEDSIDYCVFSFDTPIAWTIYDDSSDRELRFITSIPITTTTERHRDVVRQAWLG